MHMIRLLCKIRHPSKVGELLESYISQLSVVPKGSYQIRQPGSVPREVRMVLTQALREGQTCSCWATVFIPGCSPATCLVPCHASAARQCCR
jgi:hypothetical protein